MLLVTLGCDKPWETGASTAEPRPLAVSTFAARATDQYIRKDLFSGVIKSSQSRTLSFPQGGTLSRLAVKEGTVLRKGATVAELDMKRLELAQEKLTAQRDKLKAQEQDVGALRLENREAITTAIAQLRADVTRIRSLLANNGNLPNPALQQDLEAVERRIEGVSLALAESRKQVLQASIRELDAQIAELQLNMDQAVLTAPFDGIITQVFQQEGDVVGPGRPIIKLVDLQLLELWTKLPVSVAADLTKDTTLKVVHGQFEVDATLIGKIAEVDPTSLMQTVRFLLSPVESTSLLPGSVAQLRVQRTVRQSGLWVPSTALARQADGLWTAFVAQSDAEGKHRASRRLLEVAYIDGDNVRVRGAIDAREQIVAEGVHRIVPDQRVEPRNTTDWRPPAD